MTETPIQHKFPQVLARFGLTPEVFAKKILDYRRSHGYTLEDLGDLIPVGKQTVMRWERMMTFPKSRPTIKRLLDLNII